MNQPNDPHDRLLDCALREIAGGHTPPDLSARILAAAENPVTPTEEMMMERPKHTRRVWFALAIAACLLVGAGFLLPAMQSARESAKAPDPALQGASNDLDSRVTLPTPYYLMDDVEHQPPGPVITAPPQSLSSSELSVAISQSQSVQPKTYEEAIAPMEPLDPGSAGENQAADSNGIQNFYGSPTPSSREYNRLAGPHGQHGEGQSQLTDAWHQPTSRPGLQAQGLGRTAGGGGGGLGFQPVDQQFPRFTADLDGFESFGRHDRRTEDLLALAPEARDPEGRGPGEPGDQYTRIYENPFIEARGEQAVSTFSIDVDTASYANVRQFLQSGQLPPPDAVRLEELINYFDYQYEPPAADSETPFSAAMEVASCPWEPKHRLVRIALQGRELEKSKRPVSNLVFLIDVSGSMDEPNKLPLVVEGMKQLVRELGENDRVAIIVYASSEGLVLPSTPGTKQATILAALDRLQAGGSTAGGAGIQLAYQMAEDNFVKGGVNRVILCTDGDFNVGVTSTADLERMVEQKANDTTVFLSVLGFGRGNLNDAMMETISNRGNGNYHYVDNLTEARKVLVEEMTGTLVTIAKDVKIQVEFNPAQVAGYRLLGYENRMLRTEDFNDDKKDAGEIGAGHRVTALYEIVPAGEKVDVPPVDDLKYQQPAKTNEEIADSNELLTLKLRYKQPDGDTSTKIEFPLTDEGKSFSAATPDFKFATAVASFGMLLRDSEHKGNATYDAVLEIATEGAKLDPHGYRAEFLDLVRKAKTL